MSKFGGRRAFLRGVGGAAVAYPFYRYLQEPFAKASTSPKRVVFFYVPNGYLGEIIQADYTNNIFTVDDRFFPKGGSDSFTLPRTTSSLEPLKRHLLFIRGIDYRKTGNDEVDRHFGGMHQALTGRYGVVDGNGKGKGVSLDVYLASRLKSMDPTLKDALLLGVSPFNFGQLSFQENTFAPAVVEDNPFRAFKGCFGSVGASSADDREATRKSVLDVVKQDLESLRGKLGTEEAKRLDTHLQALRATEMSVQKSCSSASFDPSHYLVGGQPAREDADYKTETDIKKIAVHAKMQMDVAIRALQCDITRVVTLRFGPPISPFNFSDFAKGKADKYGDVAASTTFTEDHHTLSHYTEGNKSLKTEQFTAAQAFMVEQYAYFLSELAKIPEGDGTLLDNTTVVYFSELGDSASHSHHTLPFIVGGGGFFKTGKFIDLVGKTNPNYPNESKGLPHNKLLVSLCWSMGFKEIQSFGDQGPHIGTGPLTLAHKA